MEHLEDARARGAPKSLSARLSQFQKWAWTGRELWLSVLAVILALVTWEVLVRAGRVSALFFPAPSTIGWTCLRLLANGKLVAALSATLSRLFLGFALGALPALVLGLVMGWSRRLRAIVDPFVAALHPLPKIALLPLTMIVFGIGESSTVATVALAAFFPMLVSTMAGVREIRPIHYEVAENYGASRLRVFARVVIPGSLPLVLAGVRLALNAALLVTASVELVAAQEGLGDMIWMAWQTLRTEELYASLVAIAALGIGINTLLQMLTIRFVPWQVEREA